ncbi:MAG TPA: DUF4235 domain-containing protein [Mycobacteriales bacterium]|jgi:hypothetical protein|nr:DUF4235 domain-containing protein [Mycobacteriales bacterium]
MSKKQSDTGYKILSGVGAVLAGIVTRKAVTFLWTKVTGHEPPANPAHPEVTAAEAFGWAVVSGTAVALARVVVHRQAAVSWQRATGSLPASVLDDR